MTPCITADGAHFVASFPGFILSIRFLRQKPMDFPEIFSARTVSSKAHMHMSTEEEELLLFRVLDRYLG